MKFAALALIASTASATTINIDDNLVGQMVGNWQKAAMKLDRTLMELEKQEEKELMPHLKQLQKDLETVYAIDMQYGQKWADAAIASGVDSWKTTYGLMGCKPGAGPSGLCDNPGWFFDHIDSAPYTCNCTSFPVTISNAKTMECSSNANGQVACMYI